MFRESRRVMSRAVMSNVRSSSGRSPANLGVSRAGAVRCALGAGTVEGERLTGGVVCLGGLQWRGGDRIARRRGYGNGDRVKALARRYGACRRGSAARI